MATPGAGLRSSVPLIELFLVLATVWATFFLHGSLTEPLGLGGVALARPDLGAEAFLPAPDESGAPAVLPEAPTPALAAVHAASSSRAPTVTVAAAAPATSAAAGAPAQAHRILMIGDSMIEPIQQRAAAYFHAAGHRFISVIWYGSRTIDWGYGQRLLKTLQVYAPTYVIVVLGSNELAVRNVERRLPAIRGLMRGLRHTPAIWIGPPAWREDTGLVSLLKTELGLRFFDSSALTFERKSDGIHPTDASGIHWMDQVTEWLGTRLGSERLQLPVPAEATRYHAPAKVYPPPSR